MQGKKGNEILGVDTIVGLVGDPPPIMSIPYNIMSTEEILRQAWNALNIAILPFCFKCKEPLVWHTPRMDNVAFHCAKCGRKWLLQEREKK